MNQEQKQKSKKLKFNTARDIQKSLTKINNMLLNGQIDPKIANAITTACNTILGSMKYAEQDKKLQELEQLIKEIQK